MCNASNKKICSGVKSFLKSPTSSKHSCCDASLEMGVTEHDNHQLLGYKVKGFPLFILTANSSQQLKQRSISSTFSSHLQVTSPPTLRYSDPASFSINSVHPTLNSLSLHPTAFYFVSISPTFSFFVSLTTSSPILFLTLSYLSFLSQSSSRTCFLLPLLNFHDLVFVSLLFCAQSVRPCIHIQCVCVCVSAPSVCPGYSTLVPSWRCCWPCPGPVLRRWLLHNTSVAPT